jgi:hypothetical protein
MPALAFAFALACVAVPCPVLPLQHKFASNVVEKCLAYAEAPERAELIDEILNAVDEK